MNFVCAELVKSKSFAQKLRLNACIIFFVCGDFAFSDKRYRIDVFLRNQRNRRNKLGAIFFALEGDIVATVVFNTAYSKFTGIFFKYAYKR